MSIVIPLKPAEVVAQVASALPEAVRPNVIICGSLAAAYEFFACDGSASLRTKDVDMLFSPHAVAVDSAVAATEQLLGANWKQRVAADRKLTSGGQDSVGANALARPSD